jgi:hypothetical protein
MQHLQLTNNVLATMQTLRDMACQSKSTFWEDIKMNTDPVRKMHDSGFDFLAQKGPFLFLLENKFTGIRMLLNVNTGRYQMVEGL